MTPLQYQQHHQSLFLELFKLSAMATVQSNLEKKSLNLI